MSETAINQASAEVAITDNRSIRLYARELLKGQWNRCALLALVYIIITGVISAVPRIGGAANFIIGGPMTLGLAIVFLKISRKQAFNFEDLFNGFNSFVKAFLANLLVIIFVVLWALLLIVPGIIAALSYSLTFYIIADNPSISANDARLKSIELMKGHKTELFYLGCSFLGWVLLCIVTLGIGFLWLLPYVSTSFALFYQKVLRGKAS